VTSEPEGRFVLARALETTFVSLLALVGGRSGGNRTRWGTSRRLGGLFGVVSRAGSDRDPEVPSDGRRGLLREATWAAREAREGRAKAQRPVWEASEGRRPGEHRLLLGPNGPERRTDARSEQGSGVGVHAGPSQLRGGLDRAESSLRRRCADTPRRTWRPLVVSYRWLASDAMRLMSQAHLRGCTMRALAPLSRKSRRDRAGESRGAPSREGVLTERQESPGHREVSRLTAREKL